MATEVCIYCGSSRNIQQDHLRAKSKNGVTTVPACAKCNQSKGAKGLMEWFRWLKDNNSYRWNKIYLHNAFKRNLIAIKVRKIYNE